MDSGAGTRPMEDGVVTDLSGSMSYAEYLALPTLLSAQRPVSHPEHHDEMLFIVQHQTTELWFKLVLHELRAAVEALDADDLGRALKGVARVKHIQRTLAEAWTVLATLTPSEYLEFRDSLGASSGFQSAQYRAVEFILGNKDPRAMTVFEDDPTAHAHLTHLIGAPTLYDAFWRHLARAGLAVPASVLGRDVREPWTLRPELLPLVIDVYERPGDHWETYEAFEELVDLEENFQLWRFRHVRTVTRIIGGKRGTGGSSGVGYLNKALELTFFPELFAARTELGR
ncbi:tryptophan 2,3-dioxygenase family protein [Nakamurella sp. A5-74]|uniref:Tryptophan 2,3-dioxygenase n=1 Tax=Nakamurella sp. A5-74 TaxID=3158264 RepID=A0AAU8DXQ0_9ACTN